MDASVDRLVQLYGSLLRQSIGEDHLFRLRVESELLVLLAYLVELFEVITRVNPQSGKDTCEMLREIS